MSQLVFGATVDDEMERKGNSRFKKTEYLVLDPGEHRIRILEPVETRKYTHYIGYSYIECLGDECPICQNNKKLMYEYPDTFRDQEGWTPRRPRFYINVLDKTPTRICPKCGTEKKDGTLLCPACNTALNEPVPLNKVKVLSAGKELMEDLKIQSMSVRSENDERIDIRTYDWTVTVRGKGRDKKYNVAHRWFPGKEYYEELGDQKLFDLENVVIKLGPEEMLDLFNGASLKDIFAMRRAKKEVVDKTDLSGTEDVRAKIAESVDELFN